MENKYRLVIVKFEGNEKFEEELAKFKENRNGYYGRNDMNMQEPRPIKETRSLEVVLTEKEFQNIKNAVITEFK